jgi:hypothetical protein
MIMMIIKTIAIMNQIATENMLMIMMKRWVLEKTKNMRKGKCLRLYPYGAAAGYAAGYEGG